MGTTTKGKGKEERKCGRKRVLLTSHNLYPQNIKLKYFKNYYKCCGLFISYCNCIKYNLSFVPLR